MSLIRGLVFTPDGRYVVSAGEDKVIRVWDRRTGTTVRSIRGQTTEGQDGKVFAIALSPDGRWLAVGGTFGQAGERLVRLYEFATGRLAALLKGHTRPVVGLAFSADSRRLISGSYDNSAIVWDVERRVGAIARGELRQGLGDGRRRGPRSYAPPPPSRAP